MPSTVEKRVLENADPKEFQQASRRVRASCDKIEDILVGTPPTTVTGREETIAALAGRANELLDLSVLLPDGDLAPRQMATFDKAMSRCQELKEEITEFRSKFDDLRARRRANDAGTGPEGFRRFARGEKVADAFRSAARETGSIESGMDDFDAGDLIVARARGARTEAETRALSTTNSSDLIPAAQSAAIIDALREDSVTARAGFTTVVLDSTTHAFPGLSADPVAAWRGEAASVTLDDPTFTSTLFAPKSLTCLVKASEESLQDAVGIGQAIVRSLSAALASEIDSAILEGAGSGNVPMGILNHTGVTVNAAPAGASPDYDVLLSALESLRVANVVKDLNPLPSLLFVDDQGMNPSTLGIIMGPNSLKYYESLAESSGQFILGPSTLAQIPRYSSNRVSTNLFGGAKTWICMADWKEIMLGMRQTIRIEILKERYRDTLQVGILAHLRADVAIPRPTAVVRIPSVTLI